jgi:nitrogen fixation protein
MIIDIVCTFSATTIQAETKSVSLVLTFPATQLPSNICEEVKDCLGISPSGEADYFLNEQGDWVQVQGGGGGNQTLNEVLVEGNTTGGEDIFVSDGDALFFDNGSRVRKGVTDAGNGGAKGVALVCSLDYELKWEAGRLYTMQQDGFTIREVSHNFTFTPTVNDDITKGFVIGSRWILDNGDVYVCSDETASAAVWALQVASVPTLQQVTDEGNITTNVITVGDTAGIYSEVADSYVGTANEANDTYAYLSNDGSLGLGNGTHESNLKNTNATTTGIILEFPNKAVGSYTIATTGDIPAAQVNSDWNAISGVAEILNKPTIPAAQIQSDWTQANTSALDFIKNKPTIPSISGLVPYTGATQNVDLGTYNIIADQVALNVSPNGTLAVGMTEWNNTLGSSQTLLKGGSVTLKNGVDLVARVVNKVSPNTTLTKAAYQVVKVSGAQGQRLAVDLAQANNDNNSADTLGVVTETIAPNQEGFIITVGQIENINTTGSLQSETWADGDVLYLSPTVAGRITNIKPTGATGHIVIIGYVEYAHVNNGKIYVKIMNGWELDELHNVYINTGTLANNNALIYESSTQLWKNKTIATALGFTPENVANKQNSLAVDGTGAKYPTVDAVNNLVSTLPTNLSVIGVPTTNITATGLTVETALLVIPLPVNSNNYLFRLSYLLRTVSTPVLLMRIGTTALPINGNVGANSIGQQTQLATFTPVSTNINTYIRNFQIQGGSSGTLIGRSFTQNVSTDEVTPSGISTLTVNTTVQQYLYISCALTAAGQSVTLYGGFTQQIKMN